MKGTLFADGDGAQLPWWVTAIIAAGVAGEKLWYYLRRRQIRLADAEAAIVRKGKAEQDRLDDADRKARAVAIALEERPLVKELRAIAADFKVEVAALRERLQVEVNVRYLCEARLARLEGIAAAKGWDLPALKIGDVHGDPPKTPPGGP